MPYADAEKQKAYLREYSALKYATDPLYRANAKASAAKSRASMKAWYVSVKSEAGPCVMCGLSDYRFLHYHHINPEDKIMEVSKAARHRSRRFVLEEMAKCEILCSNCHGIITFEEQQRKDDDEEPGSIPAVIP